MATTKRTKSPSRANKAKKAKSTPAAKAKPKARPKARPKAKAKASPKAKPAAAKKKVAGAKKRATPKLAAKTKAAPKAKAKAKAKAPAKPKPKSKGRAPRQDRAGHLAPGYAKDLRARSRETRSRDGAPDEGFLRGDRTRDDLAEELGQEAVGAMTTGEERATESLNADVDEEWGGPFVPSTGGREFAEGTDASNPKDAEKEPFPRT